MDVANHNFLSMEVEGNDFGRLSVLRYLVHELNMDINKTDIDQGDSSKCSSMFLHCLCNCKCY
jgi:hypothetical protein